MKRPLAAIVAILVMSGMLWLGASRSGPPAAAIAVSGSGAEASGSQPGAGLVGATEKVEALLADAARGDVAAYLAAFRGPIRDRLARQADERGRSAFGEELRGAARARKSHAVFEAEPDVDDRARVIVESAFAGRNERQTFRLVRAGSGWVIDDVETARDQQPGHVLGAPATYEEPEGPPVPTPAPSVSLEDDPLQEP